MKRTLTLDERETSLLIYYLDSLSDYMSNEGCNDLPSECRDMFTEEEGAAIAKEYATFNNPENPEGPNWPLPNFCLLYWLQQKIEQQRKPSNEAY